jgi:ApbE superfamily uncharacterized protein (UPF0280 family)
MYEPRTYRHWIKKSNLVSFSVTVRETDLHICACTNLKRKALRLVTKYREILEGYIERHPAFLTSMTPLPPATEAPHLIRVMLEAAAKTGVGPMAAVAGAIAEFVGNELLAFSPEIIIENGGDIYLRSLNDRTIGIYAGSSPLTGRLGLEIAGADTPLGICTSSGTVGHSLSRGKADAAVAISPSAALADAAATAIGNLIKKPADIPRGIELAERIEGLKGVVIVSGDRLGLWGDVRICETSPRAENNGSAGDRGQVKITSPAR